MSHRVITLKKPIELIGKDKGTQPLTVSELRMREEIVSGDLRGIKLRSLQDPTMDDLLKIGGRLCGQTDLVMGKLGLEDSGEVVNAVLDFLGAGQTTGTTESP